MYTGVSAAQRYFSTFLRIVLSYFYVVVALGTFPRGCRRILPAWTTSELLGGVAAAEYAGAGVCRCVRDLLVCYYHYQSNLPSSRLCATFNLRASGANVVWRGLNVKWLCFMYSQTESIMQSGRSDGRKCQTRCRHYRFATGKQWHWL